MSKAILKELPAVKSWVAKLSESSKDMPRMLLEDIISLIEFHLEITEYVDDGGDYRPNPRYAVCWLWPLLCIEIKKIVEDSSDEYQPPWW